MRPNAAPEDRVQRLVVRHLIVYSMDLCLSAYDLTRSFTLIANQVS